MHFTKRLLRRVTVMLLSALMILFASCALPEESAGQPTPTPAVTPTGADDEEETNIPASNTSSAYAPFTPEITATTLRINDTARIYPDGMSLTDNVWTRAYREKLGVNFETAWSGDLSELPAAIERMVGSGTLPDYMTLPYDVFYSLARQGLLEPLDDSIDTYASPSVLSALNAYDSAARKVASYGGSVLGITPAPPRDGSMLWYRDDWFAATGRTQAPTTFEEVIELAYDFVNNPSEAETSPLGFGLDMNLFIGENRSSMGLEGVFSAYGFYPTQWQEIDGELMHGSVNPEIKQVLSLLQKWYEDGLIDKNFDQITPWSSVPRDGNIGMAFANEWFGEMYAPDLMGAAGGLTPTWTCMPIPGSLGSENLLPTTARQGDVTCVRSGYAYPELAVKMVNLTQGLLNGELAENQYRYVMQENMQLDTSFMAMAAGGHLTDAVNTTEAKKRETAAAVQEALAASNPANLSADTQYIYERCRAWEEQKDASPIDYRFYVTYGPNGSQSVLEKMRTGNLLMPDSYYGPETQDMRDNWERLMEKRNEIYISIIKGADVDRTFDEYIRFFQENGGDACTRDVNNWFAAN